MTQKSLIIVFFLLFAVSTVLLFWQNDRELNPNQGKNWWTLSFASLKQEESLSFVIENHSNQTDFQYEIAVGKELIAQETFTVERGEAKTIIPPSITRQSERVKVTVIVGNEKKIIYR